MYKMNRLFFQFGKSNKLKLPRLIDIDIKVKELHYKDSFLPNLNHLPNSKLIDEISARIEHPSLASGEDEFNKISDLAKLKK